MRVVLTFLLIFSLPLLSAGRIAADPGAAMESHMRVSMISAAQSDSLCETCADAAQAACQLECMQLSVTLAAPQALAFPLEAKLADLIPIQALTGRSPPPDPFPPKQFS